MGLKTLGWLGTMVIVPWKPVKSTQGKPDWTNFFLKKSNPGVPKKIKNDIQYLCINVSSKLVSNRNFVHRGSREENPSSVRPGETCRSSRELRNAAPAARAVGGPPAPSWPSSISRYAKSLTKKSFEYTKLKSLKFRIHWYKPDRQTRIGTRFRKIGNPQLAGWQVART